MKALSVRAPWWWAILHCGKDIENRDWYTNFRGTIYLHAGKFWQWGEIENDLVSIWHILGGGDIYPDLRAYGYDKEKMRAGCGSIVGKVDIVECHTDSASPWFFGKYGFQLANPIAFQRPVPFKGALGFFDVPDALFGGPR
jgi:hypothetical protein